MGEQEKFDREKCENISLLGDIYFKKIGIEFIKSTIEQKYSYNFTWMGRPIIQYPQDILAMQEIIWQVKPDLIIETGIAHGGSLLFYASMLELLKSGKAIGVDIEIRKYNKIQIKKSPFYNRIELIEGSSIDPKVFEYVSSLSINCKKIMVILDSNHTHEHVFNELILYSRLVGVGSYLVVFDTIIEDLPRGFFNDRPWDKGNNPKTAVMEFLRNNDQFVVDKEIMNKLLITSAPDGYLKRVK